MAVQPDTVLSPDRLIDELWGESPPPTAATKLQGLVSSLRKHLDADVIATHPGGYRLAVDPLVVDAQRFRQMVEKAGRSGPAERRELLRHALGLWRGPALEDFTYEPFAQTEIMVLEELRLKALEERIDADLALGHHRDVVPELQRLVADHPLREHLTGQIMLALYRDGRQAEALRAYQDLRHTLVEELGIEAGTDLQRLEGLILSQDAVLEIDDVTSVDPEPTTWLTERRKQVTVVFVGLPTAAAGDAEISRDIFRRANRTVTDTIERHGGAVQGVLGDVVVAVFGVPAVHEDDAIRAGRAAIELRTVLGPVDGIAVRIGLNTGDIVVGDSREQPSGATVSVASRLHQAAAPGEVLIGEETRRLLGDAAVTQPARGADVWGTMPPVWRLLELTEKTIRPSLLVGRNVELERLHSLFERTAAGRSAFLIEVMGEAGIGKSRLARELTQAIRDEALVLTGRCPAYGEGGTFWPLREIVSQLTQAGGRGGPWDLGVDAGISETASAQVAGAAGLIDYSDEPLELFGAVRVFFTRLARKRPLVLVIDDMHWAQRTFLDLLDHLARTADAPILILGLARPESVPSRWADERWERLELSPLSPEDTERLVTDRAGDWGLTAETVARVVEVVQGNPLFAEQTVAALKEHEAVTIPSSVHALLAARLELLGPEEGDLVRSAAVLGTDFSVEALSALVPERVRPFVSRHLSRLEEKGLMVQSQRPFLGDPRLAFGHVLIQAAAYRSLTRRDRANLHEQAAAWMASRDEANFDELVGYHLERAYQDRGELGIDDEHTQMLRCRAGQRLAGAGLTAFGKFDVTAAENLLTRAKALLPPDHPQRYPVMRRLAETYPMMGRLTDADAAFEELLEEIEDEYLARGVRLERLRNQMIAGPDPMTLDEVLREAEHAFAAYAVAGDETGMSQACYILASVHERAGRIDQLEKIAWEGLAHARRADMREEVGILWYVSRAMVIGPTPVGAAIRVCEEVSASHKQTHGGLLADLGLLFAMTGDFERAREALKVAHDDILERRGVRRALTHVGLCSAQVEILAGDQVAAEEKLRWALDLAEDVGETDQTSQLASTLAQVVADTGDLAEAASLAERGGEQAPLESVVAQALARAATARVLAKRGDSTGAERLIRQALELVPDDLINLRADLYCDLGLTLGDRSMEAEAAATAARAWYARKGNLVALRGSDLRIVDSSR